MPVTGNWSQPRRLLPTPADADAQWYTLFGQQVLSDIRLPLPEQPALPTRHADWRVRLMPGLAAPLPSDAPVVAAVPCEHGRIVTTLREGPSGAWLWDLGLATFFIPSGTPSGTPSGAPSGAPSGTPAGTRTVEIYPQPGAADRDLQLLVLGQVAALLLQQQGLPPLHASAVVTAHGGVAFIGPKGRGKSTIAGILARHGARLLTDDLLPLQIGADGLVYGLPGVPLMKAWDATIEHLIGAEARFPCVTAGLDKKLVDLDGRLPFHAAPAPLRAVFVLDRDPATAPGDDGCSVVPLSGRDALAALIEHTEYRIFLTPARAAALLPLYARLVRQARVLILRYASGFEQLARVGARALSEVGEP